VVVLLVIGVVVRVLVIGVVHSGALSSWVRQCCQLTLVRTVLPGRCCQDSAARTVLSGQVS
jgi:hypothetical protein